MARASCRAQYAAALATKQRLAWHQTAQLLMPTALMTSATRGLKRLRLKDVDALGNDCTTSRLAMAFRLIRMNFPLILACYSATGLRWQFRSKAVPTQWWLKQQLDQASFAYDLVQCGAVDSGTQPAEA